MEDKQKQEAQANNPLHGVKLADILETLVEAYGWEKMGDTINVRCFNYDPSIKSSLKFLRRTQWARDEVEEFYIDHIEKIKRKNK